MADVVELLEAAEAKAYYGLAINWKPLEALTQSLLDRGTLQVTNGRQTLVNSISHGELLGNSKVCRHANRNVAFRYFIAIDRVEDHACTTLSNEISVAVDLYTCIHTSARTTTCS